MPNDSYRCFFTNSGAESVETAIKFVRAATGRGRVLFADHAFHGLTTGALALNGGREFRDRFGELLPGCSSVPFGDLDALAAQFPGAVVRDGAVDLLVDDTGRALAEVVGAAERVKVVIAGIDTSEPDLEAVFLHLTGKALRD